MKPLKCLGEVLTIIVISAITSAAQDIANFNLSDAQFKRHIGTIEVFPNTTIGSAFAFGANKEIITCDHVIEAAYKLPGGTNLFFLSENQLRPLKLKYRLPKFDLAILTPTPEIPGEPFRVGDFKKIRPGDQVVYIGYDQAASGSNQVVSLFHGAIVSSIGSTLNEGRVIDFLEFPGQGLPGYSGGPVFNYKGELVAVMRQAWVQQGIKGGPPALINRAFSIDVLSMEGEVFSSTGYSTNVTPAASALLDLINLSIPDSQTNQPSK